MAQSPHERRRERQRAQRAAKVAADRIFLFEVHWPDAADDDPDEIRRYRGVRRYEGRHSRITHAQERVLYDVTGFTLGRLIDEVHRNNIAPFMVAALVFFAELQERGDSNYGDILGELVYGIECDWRPAEDGGDGPGEAPGSDSAPTNVDA